MTPDRNAGARRGRRPAAVKAGASLLAHDLKNLAGRLSVLCQNLGEHYDDPLFKSTALDVLDDTALHLRRLALDLRDHESQVLIKLRVDLNLALQDALRDTRPDLAGQIQVVAWYADLPPIWGDAFLLRQAFARAVENALEAMRGRGTLTVRTAWMGRPGGGRVLAEIADDGPGMSREFLRERLSRPFSSTKQGGLGLGIHTMRQVAALHGGTLRVLSASGAGTRVRFHFGCEEE